MAPNLASEAGLFEDAISVPSFSSSSVVSLNHRLEKSLKALRKMPWQRWNVDLQIDFRWIYAVGLEAQRRLTIEKPYLHRPAEWLEPLANNLIALVTYAPERLELRQKITSKIPAMVQEMRFVVVQPTARGMETGRGLIDGILVELRTHPQDSSRDAAIEALESYAQDTKNFSGLADYKTIGPVNYEWRLQNALLLPWSGKELLALAQAELDKVNSEMERLKQQLPPSPKPTPEQSAMATILTKESMLALYDQIVLDCFNFLRKADLLTVPNGLGPLKARETPEALIPLTGDGWSMNPPPVFAFSNTGYWNVEHFRPDWPSDKRESFVVDNQNFRETGMGPYAVHEGIPGHHLQLSIARIHPDPLRSLLADSVQNEGWALYAEQLFWESGGLGSSVAAQYNTLASWRFRIRRVFYDVNVESNQWTLQQAADFKWETKPGQGKIDEDLLRTINWPTQLIGYFAGKMQILELKKAYKNKLGPAYTERRFHDDLLAVGSIPLVFARVKLLGEPVPAVRP